MHLYCKHEQLKICKICQLKSKNILGIQELLNMQHRHRLQCTLLVDPFPSLPTNLKAT